MSRTRHHFTQKWIDARPAPDPSGKQKVYFDDTDAGLGIQVSGTTRSKVYIVQRDLLGRATRRTVGSCEELQLARAREIAREMIAAMRSGKDPKKRTITDDSAEKAGVLTLREAYRSYLALKETKKGGLREGTRRKYQYAIETYLADWQDLPLLSITKRMVLERFQKISNETGEATANDTFCALRAIWNHQSFMAESPILPPNPVNVLTVTDSWHHSAPRDHRLTAETLPKFYAAALMLDLPVKSTLARFLLFSGCRRTEAGTLMWDDVDFDRRTITIPPERHKTGGKTKRPYVVFMNDYLRDILIECKGLGESSRFVFPSPRLRDGSYSNFDHLAAVIRKQMGDDGFRLHSLRRTFVSIAAEECRLQEWLIARLVNHASGGMTARYYASSEEKLLEASQAVARKIAELSKIGEGLPENVRRFASGG